MSEYSFHCPACGQQLTGDSTLASTESDCPACHATIIVPEASAEAAPAPLPDGKPATPIAPRNSKLAIASLICSLSSLITCVGWLPGIICGHLAKSHLRRDASLKGHGLATAGLIIGYLILILETATAGVKVWSFSHALKSGFDSVQQSLATNHFTITTTNFQAGINTSQSVMNRMTWTTNLEQMEFPDHPVSGALHGFDFALKNATFRAVNLKLVAENGCALEVLGLGKSPADQNYEVAPTGNTTKVRIRLTWKEGDIVQNATFAQDYALKLDFAPAVGRKLSGKIYVCLPDETKTTLAGTFEVRLPKAK